MSKIKIFAFFVLGLMLLIGLISCAIDYAAKTTYFDGAVLSEYTGTSQYGSKQYLTLYFYEKGTYKILFSGSKHKKFPKDTVITIENVPRVKIFRNVPSRFKLAIEKNGKSEYRKFPFPIEPKK